MTQDMLSLGFDQIIEQLKDQAVSQAARRLLSDTVPIMNEGLCRARMEETTAARRVMENAGTPPLAETDGTEIGLTEALQGGMLLPAAFICRTLLRRRPAPVPLPAGRAGLQCGHRFLAHGASGPRPAGGRNLPFRS